VAKLTYFPCFSQAFKKLSATDTFPNKLHKQTAAIINAYRVVSDDVTRKAYDKYLDNQQVKKYGINSCSQIIVNPALHSYRFCKRILLPTRKAIKKLQNQMSQYELMRCCF
jgi:hypothetical protein